MKPALALPCLLAAALGCTSLPASESVDVGMTLGDAESRIVSMGGQRCEGAYPLFWFGSEGNGGYHVYYNLGDQTCLQIQVRGQFVEGPGERGYPITQLTLGPKGEPYPGKLVWFENGRQGKHESIRSVDLSGHRAAR